jgi:hypothetical protein
MPIEEESMNMTSGRLLVLPYANANATAWW